MKSRRTFIRNTMGSIGALALAPQVLANKFDLGQPRKLGVALVGLGYYATDLLAPALQLTSHCKLAGIVTGSPDKAKAWQQRYDIPDKNIYNYGNIASIADNKEIDIVYIVLPPSLHAEYAIKAANAGKHVWCEKPMAMTAVECRSMIDACNKNKVKLSIGYRMQHEPNTQRIIQFAREKKYGNITRVTAVAGYVESRTNHWKQKKAMGGGAMYDMGVYSLNAARYATQEEPIAVTAHQSTDRPGIYSEVDDTMQFKLEFPGGAIADCETSFAKNINALNVVCTKGSYKLEPMQYYNGIRGETSDGIQLNATIPNQQARQMDDDALAIINNKRVLVPGEEGMRDIAIVEAIYRSVKENRRILLK